MEKNPLVFTLLVYLVSFVFSLLAQNTLFKCKKVHADVFKTPSELGIIPHLLLEK